MKTHVVVHVRLRGVKMAQWRMSLGTWLVILAGHVMGVKEMILEPELTEMR